jgi:hypothetical protein
MTDRGVTRGGAMAELKEHFNKHRETLWGELRKQLDDKGNWSGEALRVSAGPFTVTLDVHAQVAGRGSEVVTRMRAAYINRDGFRFALKRRSWMSDLTTFLGEQDHEIGDEDFDRDWVIKSNNVAELKRMLARPNARERMSACSAIQRLEVRDDEGWFGPEFPGEVDELYLEAEGRILDAETLGELFSIFAGALTMLTHVGSAYESDPEIEL